MVWKPPADASLWRLMTGIEAGVIGGLAMLALMVSGSLLRGHPWWEIPNLLGSTFFGSRVMRSGPGVATLSGAALHFAIAGTVGGLFGLACGTIRRRRPLLLLGMLAGGLWYFIGQAAFWPHINPLVPLYAFTPVFLLAHVVFGACLGFMGQAQMLEPEAEVEQDGVE